MDCSLSVSGRAASFCGGGRLLTASEEPRGTSGAIWEAMRCRDPSQQGSHWTRANDSLPLAFDVAMLGGLWLGRRFLMLTYDLHSPHLGGYQPSPEEGFKSAGSNRDSSSRCVR